MAAFCLLPYILFSTTTVVCTERLNNNCARKRLQITQMYAERLRLATSPPELEPGERPRLIPGNGLCLGGCATVLTAHLFGLPKIPRLCADLACTRTEGVYLRQPGEVRLFFFFFFWTVCLPKSLQSS